MLSSALVVGIDASNLRNGGGLTHLIELLAAAEPKSHQIERIVVWACEKTLSTLAERTWLQKEALPS